MLCRVMSLYGLNYRDAMDLPIQAFWFMNSCVPRLQAEADMRYLNVASCVQSSEAITQIRANLAIELGEVVKADPVASAVRDEEGFQALKALAG